MSNEPPFKTNDLVRLLLGGPTMQVVTCAVPPGHPPDSTTLLVTAVWFNKNDEIQSQMFSPELLIHATRLH